MTTGAFVSCQGLAAACIAWGVDPKQEGETRTSTVKQEEREESIQVFPNFPGQEKTEVREG